MKKGLSLLLALCLCLGAALPTFADQPNSELVAQLILSAKEKLSVSDEKFVFSDYYQMETEQGTRYELNWESKDEMDSAGIRVEIGDTGTIFRYNLYGGIREYGKLKYPQKTEEEALAAAKEYFRAIDADKAAQVTEGKITYNTYNNSYSYAAERLLGGIPVFEEGLTLQMDADSLTLTDYTAEWTEGLTASQEDFLSFEEAAAAYREKLGYELFYQVTSSDKRDEVRLVYRSKYDETLYLDAVSGEITTFAEIRERGSSGGAKNEAASAAKDAAVLSPEEKAMVDEIAKMLSKDKAEQIARGVKEFRITKDYTVEHYNIWENSHGKYIGNIGFRLEKDEKYGYRSVSIDVQTGEVVAFNSYDGGGIEPVKAGAAEKKELTAEQGQKIAESFLKKYYPQKFESMTPKTVYEPQASYVQYQRTENGVKVYNNGANVRIDGAAGGAITAFSLEWTDAEFPQVAAADLQKLYEKLLAEENFRCGYLVSYDEQAKKPFAKAVYRLETKPVYDAESLQKLDWRLRPTEEQEPQEYTDISGHYCEEIVKKLAFMGIYYPGSLLRPNDAVTQKEYLRLIAQVLYQYSPDDDEDLYQNMIRRGVLTREEMHPEEPVLRIEGIRYLLKAMGYREFAEIPGIFRCPFTDLAEADQGYGAIAAGLGLVDSETDTFYASNPLRRGDSLIMIYRYLNR